MHWNFNILDYSRGNIIGNSGIHQVELHQMRSWPSIQSSRPSDTKRGAAALSRLKAYEGIPPPYDKIKRMVIPDALKVLRFQAGHKYCLLVYLSSVVGWNHYGTIRVRIDSFSGVLVL
ncbi:hypothetical protein M0R45_006506 [Rubus argutus]|uniref:Uncharacterized protein n=1 Tax=Rubus argutus TaxID=59490 RepID=A0AAW1YR01_RUBAR